MLKNNFQNFSIRTKLIFLFSLSAGVALFLATTSSFIYNMYEDKNTLVTESIKLAKVSGKNIAASLMFEDRDSANSILQPILNDKNVHSIKIYDIQGHLFTTIGTIGNDVLKLNNWHEDEFVNYTEIDDRIMLTGNIKETISPQVKEILNANGVGRARYFTNAISTKTEGIDLRLNYKYLFKNRSIIKTGMSYHYNDTDVTGINTAPSILGANGQNLLMDDVTIVTLEDGQPKENIKIYTQYLYNNYSIVVNINKFGSYKSVFGTSAYDFDSTWTTDLDLSYQLNDKFNVAIGAENLFDEYPDKWGETITSIAGPDKVIKYSQYSPFGYNGAYYYIRMGLSF